VLQDIPKSISFGRFSGFACLSLWEEQYVDVDDYEALSNDTDGGNLKY
jgi:hypothetical protein